MRLSREFYVPKASLKVKDKASDAVAYVYDLNGTPCAAVFYGRRAKPVAHYRFKDQGERERSITRHFEGRRKSHDRDAERRAERNKPHTLELGHILVASWGYEQTNIDFYQVTRIVGRHMVEVRAIAGMMTEATGWAMGKSVPKLDEFTGPVLRRRVSGGNHVKIDSSRRASIWGGRPESWTSYG